MSNKTRLILSLIVGAVLISGATFWYDRSQITEQKNIGVVSSKIVAGYFEGVTETSTSTLAGNLSAKNITASSGITADNFYGPLTGQSSITASDNSWASHNSFPSACSSGQYVTAVGDTLTCAAPTLAETDPIWSAASTSYAKLDTPTFTGSISLSNPYPASVLNIADSNASHYLGVRFNSDLSSTRYLTLATGDADRTLTLTGNSSLQGTNTGDQDLSVYPTYTYASSSFDTLGRATTTLSGHTSTYSHDNFNTAYTDRLKWDGGSTGLTAATGRTSLGLTDTATLASTTFQTRADWTTHDNYPAACGAGLAVGTIGDTLTCINPVASSDATWTLHNNWPSACSAGSYVTAIGDTLTCGALTTMTYPAAGMAVSTGSAWGTSIASTTFYLASNPNSYTAAETTSTIGALINGSTATTTPADTDRFAFSASSILRYITWANIKAYFDTKYDSLLTWAEGSLRIGTGSGTSAMLTLGSDGQQLTASSTATTGIIWASATKGLYTDPGLTTPATTTLGVATTTFQLKPIIIAQTWDELWCYTNIGTSTITFATSSSATSFTSPLVVTTAIASTSLTANNNFSSGSKLYLNQGNNSASTTQVSCSVKKINNNDK